VKVQGRTSPDFSPWVWKGGALAPPFQNLPDYSSLSRPAQLAAGRRGDRGARDGQKIGARFFGGAEAPPFRRLEEKGLAWRGNRASIKERRSWSRVCGLAGNASGTNARPWEAGLSCRVNVTICFLWQYVS
jgi:hypothetical protein